MTDNDMPRGRWRGPGLIPALVLIAIGLFFLLRNLGVHLHFPWPRDWWAWAILVVALVPLSRAWSGYRRDRRFSGDVARDLLNALVLVIIAVMFLLHLAWAIWWPLFMIYGGLYLLARRADR